MEKAAGAGVCHHQIRDQLGGCRKLAQVYESDVPN